MNVGLRAQKTASAGPAEYFDLFSDDGRPAGGSGRRHCLSRGRSRGFSGRALEYALVPQVGDLVLDFLQKIDAPALVEQVIAVPKISLDPIPQRSVCRRPWRAEQLVEVPSTSSDIPPHGRGDQGGGRRRRGL